MPRSSAATRVQRGLPFPIAAPTGGLNARDALAAMPPQDASVMDNLFPLADRVKTRAGFVLLSTAGSISMAGQTEGFRRLLSHVKGQTETLFAAFFWIEDVGGQPKSRLRIYSVNTSTGALTNVREAITTATLNGMAGLGEWTQFTSASGLAYSLLMVSSEIGGVTTSKPQIYDGTTWADAAITGLPANMLGVHAHRGRLWFYGSAATITEPLKTLSAWYLPTGAVAGAVTEFNLGPFASKGGTIVSMRTWRRDGGDGGADDAAVFVTDQGQVLLYAGTDPSAAATWQLVGVFDVGKLASWQLFYANNDPQDQYGFFMRDTFAKTYGADVLIMAQTGVISLNKLVAGGAEIEEFAISSKIQPALNDAARGWAFGGAAGVVGWKLEHMPILQQLTVNVPTDLSLISGATNQIIWVSERFVMNTVTGAWTKFTGINALDSVVVGSKTYFTNGSRKLYRYDGDATADVSYTDNSAVAIAFECRQAYNYLQSPTNKLATLMQPMLRATGNFSMTVQADADFNGGTISTYKSYTVASTQNVQPILSANKYGRAFATHMKGQTSVGVVSWYATNYTFRNAGLV